MTLLVMASLSAVNVDARYTSPYSPTFASTFQPLRCVRSSHQTARKLLQTALKRARSLSSSCRRCLGAQLGSTSALDLVLTALSARAGMATMMRSLTLTAVPRAAASRAKSASRVGAGASVERL